MSRAHNIWPSIENSQSSLRLPKCFCQYFKSTYLLCISPKIFTAKFFTIVDDDELDDELSTRAAVAISVVVTFIITLVVTALVTYIITSLYYKHLIDHIRKSVISKEGDPHALVEDDKRHVSAYAITRIDIPMATNPAYGIATTIKMDINPAYAVTTD